MADNRNPRRRNTPFMSDSMAYDLPLQTGAAERYSTASQTRPKTKPKQIPQAASRPAAHAQMVVRPAAVVLALISLAVWVFTLQVKTEISQAQTEVYRLESELAVVQQEQDDLRIRYESAFCFTELEDYAVNMLGMQRPRDEQIFYLSQKTEDHAVAVAARATAGGLVDRFGDFVADLMSYFK